MLITNWTFNETLIITQFVSNVSEIKELFENSGNNLETSVDPFITFLDLLHIKYHQTQVKIIVFFNLYLTIIIYI